MESLSIKGVGRRIIKLSGGESHYHGEKYLFFPGGENNMSQTKEG